MIFFITPERARAIIADHREARRNPTEAAVAMDATMRELSRASELLDRMLGRGLSLLARGNGFLKLGYASMADYAAERIGMKGRQAQELAWLERGLPEYPATEALFAEGRLSYSKVRLLLRAFARPGAWPFGEGDVGDVTFEEGWAHSACGMTVRDLKDALHAWTREASPTAGKAGDGFPIHEPEDDDDEPLGRWISFKATPPQAAKWHVFLEMARRQASANIGAAACLEGAIAEFMTGEGYDLVPNAGFPGFGVKTDRPEPEPQRTAAPADPPEEGARPEDALPWRLNGLADEHKFWRDVERDIAEMNAHWAHLSWEVPRCEVPLGMECAPENDPFEIDHRLAAIVTLKRRGEYNLMRLLSRFVRMRLYFDLEFARPEQYGSERLGLSGSSVRSQVSLFKRLARLPRTAEAFEQGRLNRSQAYEISRIARDTTEEPWIERARQTTVRFLRDDVNKAFRMWELVPPIEAGLPPEPRQTCARPEAPPPRQTCARPGDAASRQTCAPPDRPTAAPDFEALQTSAPMAQAVGARTSRGSDFRRALTWMLTDMRDPDDDDAPEWTARVSIRFWLPAAVAELWEEACAAVQILYGGGASIADCVETFLDAYLAQYGDEALEAVRRHPAIDAMNWTCAVPTCTNRANLEAHHVKYRSHGGATAADNLVPLCSIHHHHGEHEGRLHVWGKAPDQLVWALGIREDEPPHLLVQGRRIVGGSARSECRPAEQVERRAAS